MADDASIGQSEELQDFLTPSHSLDREPEEESLSRKSTLARKMTGVFHSIKDALPTFDDEHLGSPTFFGIVILLKV